MTAAVVIVVLATTSDAGAQATTTTDPPPVTTTTMAPTTTAAPTTRAPVTTRTPQTTAAPRTTVATTARPVTTTAPAPTTTVASSTTVVSVAPATSPPSLLVAGPNDTSRVAAEPESSGLSSGAKLRLVIGGLIAVAIAIAALTVAYWRHTRPYEWEQYEEPVDDPTQAMAAVDPVGEGAGGAPTVGAAAVGAVGAADPGADGAATNGAGGNGGSGSPPSGPVVPSLIPADVLAPQLSIITLEDLEQSSGETASGAVDVDGDGGGPPTAPLGAVEAEELPRRSRPDAP